MPFHESPSRGVAQAKCQFSLPFQGSSHHESNTSHVTPPNRATNSSSLAWQAWHGEGRSAGPGMSRPAGETPFGGQGVVLGIQPRVKTLRSSYTGLYPQSSSSLARQAWQGGEANAGPGMPRQAGEMPFDGRGVVLRIQPRVKTLRSSDRGLHPRNSSSLVRQRGDANAGPGMPRRNLWGRPI